MNLFFEGFVLGRDVIYLGCAFILTPQTRDVENFESGAGHLHIIATELEFQPKSDAFNYYITSK